MKVFFDTSVLVPLFQTTHAHHAVSYAVIQKHLSGPAFCSAHTLAEVYSGLTSMPPPHRVSAERAMPFVTDLRAQLTPVEVFKVICDLASSGVVGGAVYDGLIAQCALKAKADIIYSWNIRHFQRLGPEIERRLRVPAQQMISTCVPGASTP